MLLVEIPHKTQYKKMGVSQAEWLNMTRGERLPEWDGILVICVSQWNQIMCTLSKMV